MRENCELKVTQVFKNYKELALFLGEDVKTGNAKLSQIKDWERFFTYEKQGNKFVITGIYDEPLKYEEKRGGARNNKYGEYIDLLVLDMLACADGNRITATMSSIFSENDNIRLLSNVWNDSRIKGKDKLAEKFEISVFSVNQYFQQVNTTLTNMLKSSLNRLQKQGYITWNKEYFLKTNKHGSLVASEYSADMPEKIKEIEDTYLDESGMTRFDIYNSDNYEIFRESTVDLVNDYTDGDVWTYWSVFDIKLVATPCADIQKKELTTGLIKVLIASISKSLYRKEATDKNTNEKYHPFQGYKLSEFVENMNRRLFVECKNNSNATFSIEEEALFTDCIA